MMFTFLHLESATNGTVDPPGLHSVSATVVYRIRSSSLVHPNSCFLALYVSLERGFWLQILYSFSLLRLLR